MKERKKPGRKPIPPEEHRVGVTIRLQPEAKEKLERAAYWLRKKITELVEPVILARLEELSQQNGSSIFRPIPSE